MTDILELGKSRAEELGLIKRPNTYAQMVYSFSYDADDIHRLLGSGIGVFGHKVPLSGLHAFGEQPLGHDDLSALAIGILPITQEPMLDPTIRYALERLVRDHNTDGDVVEKAKQLLERKG